MRVTERRPNGFQSGGAAVVPPLHVKELLGREEITVDLSDAAGYLAGETVLVTGAGGSIGAELCRQVGRLGPGRLLLLGHGENSIYEAFIELRQQFPDLDLPPIIADIRDGARIEQIFAQHRPGVVFHAAAHKHVPLMEENPTEAITNNIFGTLCVAQAAHRAGARRFVLISSDKAVNPTSVMGATKRAAECITQSFSVNSPTVFAAVRFGNVLGSRGSVIPLFQRQIAAGGPVTVTHPDMRRYFMTIPEAVQLVIQAASLARGGEIFVLDMGRPVRILDLARGLIRLAGLEPDVDIPIIFTGIRPGEKLFEELLTAEEGVRATRCARIWAAKPDAVPAGALERFLEEMRELAAAGIATSDQVLQAVRNLVGLKSYQGALDVGD